MPATPFVIEEYVRWSDVDAAGILDDRLRVAAYVGRVGTSSMTLNFDVLRHGSPSLGAAGWMVLVCVGRHDLKPRPLPAELLQALARHTLSPEAARAALGVTLP